MSDYIAPESLLRSLPDVLRNDEDMYNLAYVIAEQFAQLNWDTDKARIFPNLNILDEETLDTLAYDFKVDWWDYNLTVQEKQNTLRNSWYVHKHMGTPAAIKSALSAIYSDVEIAEWYEYDGEPYHFGIKVRTGNSVLDIEKHNKILALVKFYKNLRSILDSTEYTAADMVCIESVNSGIGVGYAQNPIPLLTANRMYILGNVLYVDHSGWTMSDGVLTINPNDGSLSGDSLALQN